MTLTRSTPEDRRLSRRRRGHAPFPLQTLLWMAASSLLIAAGLLLAWQSRLDDLSAGSAGLASGGLIQVNQLRSADTLQPLLTGYDSPRQRTRAARVLLDAIRKNRPFENLRWLNREMRNVDEQVGRTPRPAGQSPGAALRAHLIVREPAAFSRSLLLWSIIYFTVFYLVFFAWWRMGFSGDWTFLPAIHLLTGIALIMMVALRHPLRDELLFRDFAVGVALGCPILLLAASDRFNHRRLQVLHYAPAVAAAVIFVLLEMFGSGPGTSTAKVNLWFFQPVELIKLLLVVFYAAYFSRRWEHLRDLKEKGFGMQRLPEWARLPRFNHLLPVAICTAGALLMFFVLKDLGPALVISCVFLMLFAVARARPGLSVLGLLLMVAGFAAGYLRLLSGTVFGRIQMWLSPFDNTAQGGDQVAQSLWALATGGALGSGIGWGDAAVIPADHTDMIISSIGEEWGFLGVFAIFLLYGYIAYRGFRIAREASGVFAFFLALGATSLLVMHAVVIFGGAFGAIPLSGVAAPFLCWGKSSMIANFVAVALLLSVSARPGVTAPVTQPFRNSGQNVLWILLVCGGLLLARAAWIQLIHAPDIAARDALALVAGGSQGVVRNPRITAVENLVPRGDIYDRNGILLATSSWSQLEANREKLRSLGVSLEECCSKADRRHYPFGGLLFHILGDRRTRARYGAGNTSFVEKVSNNYLQGYDDVADILPAMRRLRQPNQPALTKLIERDKTLRATVDIRLQQRAARILADALVKAHKRAGALVAIDVDTGDLLASVNLPVPAGSPPVEPSAEGGTRAVRERVRPYEDVARFGAYTPGSTFKLVTALAALRKDAASWTQHESCRLLGDGRAGTQIRGYGRTVRDDAGDPAHGNITMQDAIRISCNAYFSQLATYQVGADALSRTADLFGISTHRTVPLKKTLPDAGYGQGEIATNPLQMALVSVTIARGGALAEYQPVFRTTTARRIEPERVVSEDSARRLSEAMRLVVTSGTARRLLAASPVPIAGKTGTAQVGNAKRGPGWTPDDDVAHSWFTGFAPYGAKKRIAFAVFVEHGGYGGAVAAPIAAQLVLAAKELGVI